MNNSQCQFKFYDYSSLKNLILHLIAPPIIGRINNDENMINLSLSPPAVTQVYGGEMELVLPLPWAPGL